MKKTSILLGSITFATTAFAAGAANSAAIESARFESAAKHLDLGGSTFLYNDCGGLADGIAQLVQKQWEAEIRLAGSREIPPNFPAIVAKLGLADIEAAGFSSKAAGDMYTNKAILLTKTKPTGVLTALGPVNRSPIAPSIAPESTHLLAELDLNGNGLKDTFVQAVAIGAPGEQAKPAQELNEPIWPGFPLTRAELAQYLTGKTIVGIQIRDKETITVDGKTLPAIDLAVVLENRPALVEKLRANLDAVPEAKMQENGTFKVYTLDFGSAPGLERYKPVLAVRKADNSVFLCTNKTTLNEWVGTKGPKLKDAPDFRRLCGESQEPGIALAYISPAFATTAARVCAEQAADPHTHSGERAGFRTAMTYFALVNKGAGASVRQLGNGISLNARTPESAFTTTTISIASLVTDGFGALIETGLIHQMGTGAKPCAEESSLPDEN